MHPLVVTSDITARASREIADMFWWSLWRSRRPFSAAWETTCELEMEGVKRLGELPIWVRVLLTRFVPACSLSYSLLEGKHLQMDPWDPEMSLWLLLFLGLAARELQLLFLYIKGLVATYDRHRDENDFHPTIFALQEVLREVFWLEVETWKRIFWMVTFCFAWSYYIEWYIIPNWTWLTIWLLLCRCREKFSTIASLDLTSQSQAIQVADLLAAALDRLASEYLMLREEPRPSPASPFEPRDRSPTPAVPSLPWMPSPIPESLDDEIPEEFKCPISGNVMSQPAIWNGHTYEWGFICGTGSITTIHPVSEIPVSRKIRVDLHLIETEEGKTQGADHISTLSSQTWPKSSPNRNVLRPFEVDSVPGASFTNPGNFGPWFAALAIKRLQSELKSRDFLVQRPESWKHCYVRRCQERIFSCRFAICCLLMFFVCCSQQ